MSTKGTHIPDWLAVPFAGITPAPSQEKGQDLFPTGNWRSIRPVYRDKMPPCNNACGTNEKIQGYLDLVKRGKYLDAYALIKEDMPFPSVTGRVCYHPCEQACNRGKYDEAISIRAVERFLGDLGQALPKDVVKAGPPNGKKVAVVGSGPAGHSAAYQLARLGYKVTILEKSPKAGGLNRGGIPDWVLPQDILDREIERLVELGITIKTNTEVGKDVTWAQLEKDYDAVILAVGLIDANSARAEGEDKEGVIFGLPFLRDIGMGTSKVKLGPRVAVIGGGNTAIDCAREALRQGAVEVTMITVEQSTKEMPCVPEDLHDMLEEGVELMHGRAVTAVLGNGKIDALQLHAARFSGAINASPITIDRQGAGERFPVDNVIIAVGQRASLKWLPEEFKNERGTIKVDRFGRLGNTKVFAAGDIVQLGSGQPLMVVNAVGDGKRVAFSVDKVLKGEPLQERMVPLDVITDLARMNMTYFPKFPRVQQAMLPPVSRKKTQEEVIQAYSEEQAVEEANRCFSCGTCNACDNCYLVCPEPCIARPERSNGLYKILVDYCKGCRVCIEECPTGCLEGVPELDFDTGVVRMDTAFAISQGLHGRQAEELRNLPDRAPKEIATPNV
jgi:NADPH-dependent glutamate synthase beta subunit-like oxidoreductase